MSKIRESREIRAKSFFQSALSHFRFFMEYPFVFKKTDSAYLSLQPSDTSH